MLTVFLVLGALVLNTAGGPEISIDVHIVIPHVVKVFITFLAFVGVILWLVEGDYIPNFLDRLVEDDKNT